MEQLVKTLAQRINKLEQERDTQKAAVAIPTKAVDSLRGQNNLLADQINGIIKVLEAGTSVRR